MTKLMKVLARFGSFAAVLGGWWASPAAGGDWPTFRGADRTAVSTETGLLSSWPADGPSLVWNVSGAGRGYASLAIAAGKIYTLGDAPSGAGDQDEYLLCFGQQDGQPIWKTKTGPAWNSGQPDWQGSRSTPTVAGDRVYVLTPHGVLICCEAKSGAKQWSKDLKKEFRGNKGDGWGYSESVLIDGDRLICTPGGSQATMVALDKQTGDLIWTAVRPDDRGAGHSSAVSSEVNGVRVYVQTTAGGALGVRASDGKLMWSYPIERTTAVIPTPIVRGDLVFFTAGYNRGGALLRQKAAGDSVSMEEVYPLNPQLNNKHGGVVLVGDYLYGDTDARGIPFCAELLTGKQVWTSRGSGKGSASIVAADGRLYIHYSDGTMVLAEASPAGYKELGKFKAPGSGERPSWSHPVILDGKLYLREQDRLLCYDLVRANRVARK